MCASHACIVCVRARSSRPPSHPLPACNPNHRRPAACDALRRSAENARWSLALLHLSTSRCATARCAAFFRCDAGTCFHRWKQTESGPMALLRTLSIWNRESDCLLLCHWQHTEAFCARARDTRAAETEAAGTRTLRFACILCWNWLHHTAHNLISSLQRAYPTGGQR